MYGHRLWIARAIAFTPALAAAALVWAHAVNVPMWDDWERAALVEAWQAGTLDLAQLYAPHLEHRILLPRLLMLANLELTGGNLVFEMAASFLLVCGAAIGVAVLLRRTVPERALAATFLANLAIFSPLQWENYLWAIQTAFLVPFACLPVALAALYSRARPALRFGIAWAATVVATHSFAHGLLLWGVVPLFVLLDPDERHRRAFLGAWLLAGAVVLVPYFGVGGFRNAGLHAYGQAPGDTAPAFRSLAVLAERPRAAVSFALSVLGNPLARTGWWPAANVAPVIGMALLAFYAAAALEAARSRGLLRRALPWLALGGTAIAASVLTALGRAGLTQVSLSYSLISHYVTTATPLLVSLVALGALLLPSRVAGLAGVALLAAQGLGWTIGIEGMRIWKEARLHGRTSLVYLEHLTPRYGRLDGDAEVARAAARILDRYGYLDPPLADAPVLAPFALSSDPEPGRILKSQVRDGVLEVQGRGLTHSVLLVLGGGVGSERVVGIGEGQIPARPFVDQEDHRLFNSIEEWHDGKPGRWKAEIPVASLPELPLVELEVLAVDAEAMRVRRLAERVRLVRTPQGLVAEIDRGGPGVIQRSPR